MPWPASQILLSRAVGNSSDQATFISGRVQKVRDDSLAGPINRDVLRFLQLDIDRAINLWDTISVLPGIVQAVRNELFNQSFDVVGNFETMHDTALSLRDWIHTNYPTHAGSGADLTHTTAANGVSAPLTFTTADLAAFRVEADLFTATIT